MENLSNFYIVFEMFSLMLAHGGQNMLGGYLT